MSSGKVGHPEQAYTQSCQEGAPQEPIKNALPPRTKSAREVMFSTLDPHRGVALERIARNGWKAEWGCCWWMIWNRR